MCYVILNKYINGKKHFSKYVGCYYKEQQVIKWVANGVEAEVLKEDVTGIEF